MDMLIRCAEDNVVDTVENMSSRYGISQELLSECVVGDVLKGKHFHIFESEENSSAFDNIYINKSWLKNREDIKSQRLTKQIINGKL